MNISITPMTGSVTASARVNVRQGLPSTKAPLARQLEKGEAFEVLGVTAGEPVAGQDDWYLGEGEHYVWAGAVRLDGEAFSSVSGLRREDGTLRPMTIDMIQSRFGRFEWSELAGGRIRPDADWVKKNIVTWRTPQFAKLGFATLPIHRRALPYFANVMAAMEDKGLTSRILTVGGTYVPRHKGWSPARTLSSHSWGIAIDLNVAWNGYGVEPAPLGGVGSLRDLVPLFESEGFAWGGRFSPVSQRDGMHFELARTDLGPYADD